MVFILKKGAGKQEIEELRKLLGKRRRGVDTMKFCGTLKLKEDPLSIQKKLRNEWE